MSRAANRSHASLWRLLAAAVLIAVAAAAVTGCSLAPQATPTPAALPTGTPARGASATPTMLATATALASPTPAPPTATRIPPTATLLPTVAPTRAAATATPVPPTAVALPPTPELVPVCYADRGRLNLYAGPAKTYAVVVALGLNEEVRPLARTPDGSWIQVVTLDDIQGWLEFDLGRCQNLDPGRLIVVVAPPTPVASLPTATPAPPTQTPAPTAIVITDWLGEYFANSSLSGAPALVRNDVAVNFDWSVGAAAPPLPADVFSARWTRAVGFAAGTYRFYLRVDDGARLFIDDALALNMWELGSLRTWSADVALTAGLHRLRVEYFENGGSAACAFWWETGQSANWRGEYYATANLSGAAVLVRDDPAVNFDWGAGSPAAGIPPDSFSARWTREADFDAGTYRFRLRADDGVRLWVDGGIVLDEWHAATATYTKDIALTGGRHSLRVEYFESGGLALISVAWERVTDTFPNYRGEYYANEILAGSPVLVRNEAVIDFIWGDGGPDSRLGTFFSARWTGRPVISAGQYVLHVESRDGVRVWVNGVLMMDAWRSGPVSAQAYLTIAQSEPQDLRVEYFHHSGSAYAHVWWSIARVPVPQ